MVVTQSLLVFSTLIAVPQTKTETNEKKVKVLSKSTFNWEPCKRFFTAEMCTDVSDWLSVLKFFFHFADCTIYVLEKGGEVGVLISLFPLLVMQKCFINPNSLC